MDPGERIGDRAGAGPRCGRYALPMGRTRFTTARSPGTNSGNMPTCPMRWRRKTWRGARPRFVPPVRAELVEAPFFSGNAGQEDENGPSTSSGRTDVGGCLLKAAVL